MQIEFPYLGQPRDFLYIRNLPSREWNAELKKLGVADKNTVNQIRRAFRHGKTIQPIISQIHKVRAEMNNGDTEFWKNHLETQPRTAMSRLVMQTEGVYDDIPS